MSRVSQHPSVREYQDAILDLDAALSLALSGAGDEIALDLTTIDIVKIAIAARRRD